MRLCVAWRCWPSKSSAVQKSTDEEECEIVQSNRPKGEGMNEKTYSLAEATEEIERKFNLSDVDVQRVTNGFVKQMNEGLCKHGEAIEQLPSFITQLPNGHEIGTYLAVDMGGTNIRVCAVTFNGDGTYSMVQDKVAIPSALMTSNSCMELFDWVAQRVEGFVEKRQVETTSTDHGSARTQSKVSFDLGFTFSHAVQQKSINSGTLIRWSKGFDIDGVVGRDVCTLLQEAFDRHALPVRVTALTNDTVGTLLSQAYGAPPRSRTLLGAVFGTGTNGAYVEKASKITKDESLATSSEKMMIVNTEWGNFDQRLEFLSTTTYDRIIDASSVNPGFEMFEKQISGMYLGELLRLAVLSLSPDHSPGIFIEMNIPKNSGLYVPWSLDTSFLSHLESDTSPELSTSRLHIEQWLGSAHVSYDVASTIKRIARAIVRRSARLSAVALGAVLVQTGCLAKDVEGDKTCIGVDGSLIELYPGFIAEIRQALKSIEQIGERGEARVDITIAKNGSGVGAALAAHIAAKHLLS